MSEWVHNSYIKVVKNENYYDPNFAVPADYSIYAHG